MKALRSVVALALVLGGNGLAGAAGKAFSQTEGGVDGSRDLANGK